MAPGGAVAPWRRKVSATGEGAAISIAISSSGVPERAGWLAMETSTSPSPTPALAACDLASTSRTSIPPPGSGEKPIPIGFSRCSVNSTDAAIEPRGPAGGAAAAPSPPGTGDAAHGSGLAHDAVALAAVVWGARATRRRPSSRRSPRRSP